MSGPWETQLHQLAVDVDWGVDSSDELAARLQPLQKLLAAVDADSGLQGAAGDAASASVGAVTGSALALLDDLARVQRALRIANESRAAARAAEADLPQGELEGWQASAISAVATGLTIPLGPISVVAGPTAVNTVNGWLGNNRENAARAAVIAASEAISGAAATPIQDPGAPDATTRTGRENWGSDDTTRTTRTGGSTPKVPTLRHPDPTTFSHPDLSDTTGSAPTGTGATATETGTTASTGGWSTGAGYTTQPISVDGPTASGATGVAGMSTLGGPGLTGSAGTGSGWSSGAGALAGGLGAAAVMGAGALARGGVRGIGAIGGLGTGAGVGGAGSGARGSGARGRLGATADGETERTGGLRGATAGTGGRSGTAPGAVDGAEGRPGAPGGAGMMGGGAGSSSERRSGRGLGGPIAPKLEDDPDVSPRSPAAGPGGRDA